MEGKILHIPEGKYYGFILAEDNRKYFFHQDDLINHNWPPNLGDKVIFTNVNTEKGPRARDVKVIL